MARKNLKQKQNAPAEAVVVKRQRVAQVILAVFAVLLIVSMVLSAVAKY